MVNKVAMWKNQIVFGATLCGILPICTALLSCYTSVPSNPTTEVEKSNVQQPLVGSVPSSTPFRVEGEVIWTGDNNGTVIRWTTKDLYIQTTSESNEIWGPLVEKGFNDFVETVQSGKSDQEKQPERCTYDRRFRLLSIVGTRISFEDNYSEDCGGAHPGTETRFTAVDLSRPGGVFYNREPDTPIMNADLKHLGKIAKLTDYFTEHDILQALLADPIIKKALAATDHIKPPQTLNELSELFAADNYGLGEIDFELRPDFLTRFAFHHIEGNKVAVRLGLPPHSGASSSEQMQIGLLLPISDSLRQELGLAVSRKQGFLMKDADKIGRDKITKFSFKTG